MDAGGGGGGCSVVSTASTSSSGSEVMVTSPTGGCCSEEATLSWSGEGDRGPRASGRALPGMTSTVMEAGGGARVGNSGGGVENWNVGAGGPPLEMESDEEDVAMSTEVVLLEAGTAEDAA